MTLHCTESQALDLIFERLGNAIIAATPLGLGKPNELLNALHAAVKADPNKSLTLFTALSLARPQPKPGLEQRFLQPFLDRHFGTDYPDLLYVKDRLRGDLPERIRIIEFYLQSGLWLNNEAAQGDYASINYTHVARDVALHDPNLIVQMVARRGDQLSLSCNPDVSLDLLDEMVRLGKPRPLFVAVVHPDLPFIGNDAMVDASLIDILIELPSPAHRLFALPREPVLPIEHAIGLHASTWVKDGGTLQIGIGALSDAIVNALIWREQDPNAWQAQTKTLSCTSANGPESGRFELGLYGASEMVMDGFMHLRRAGILKRRVYDDLGLQRLLNSGRVREVADESTLDRLLEAGVIELQAGRRDVEFLQHWGWLEPEATVRDGILRLSDGSECSLDFSDAKSRACLSAHMQGRRLQRGRYLHGGFWAGSKLLIDWLKQLQGEDFDGLSMTRISHINQLYGGREALEIEQRHHARFFNTCMMQTLLGAAVSDGLANGQVVSGVGGQYNFVAMAHAIPNGRSALLLRSTRESSGQLQSNIVWNYGHTTIPRHLRDLVITEYGIADVRGHCDREVITRLLAISDARCIPDLIRAAQAAGKLSKEFVMPDAWQGNTPIALADRMRAARGAKRSEVFPFGSDLDEQELRLGKALKFLKSATGTRGARLSALARALMHTDARTDAPTRERTHAALTRLQLQVPGTLSDRLLAKLVRWALAKTT